MHGVKRRQWSQEALRRKKLEDKVRINGYRCLTAEVLDSKGSKDYSPIALAKTTQLLDLNPEFNAVWNYRRDIISHISVEAEFWTKELSFIMQLLKRFPKVYWIWNHRLWVLHNYPSSPIELWETELSIVEKLLQMDARNFHGWHYRKVLVAQLELLTSRSMDQKEFEYVTKCINNNISNFSAWHYRAKLIPRMFASNEIPNKKEFIQKEISYITNAMFTDAEDQSVWMYIKWFIKDSIVADTLSKEEYSKMIREMENNITVINENELEFSGKQNMWCVKTLLVLENVKKELPIEYKPKRKVYIEQLIKADPLRRQRYIYLLNE